MNEITNWPQAIVAVFGILAALCVIVSFFIFMSDGKWPWEK